MLTALSFTKALFCSSPGKCNSCHICSRIDGLQHPDLHLILPEKGTIKTDLIRNVQKELALHPVEAPAKVCIVIDAHQMNQAAANAFLKTLEEPPGRTVIILLSSSPAMLLPTILSRCQKVRFNPLSEEIIINYLTELSISREQASSAAALAGGSMDRALAIAQDGLLTRRKEIIEQVMSLTARQFGVLTAAAEHLGREREQAHEVIEVLTLFYRDVMLFNSGSSGLVNSDLYEFITRTASTLTPRGIMDRLDAVTRAGYSILRNVNPRLTLESLFLTLAIE